MFNVRRVFIARHFPIGTKCLLFPAFLSETDVALTKGIFTISARAYFRERYARQFPNVTRNKSFFGTYL